LWRSVLRVTHRLRQRMTPVGRRVRAYRAGPGRRDLCANLCSHSCGNNSVTGGLPVVTLRTEQATARVSSRICQCRNQVMGSLAHHTVQPRNAVRPSARSSTGVICSRAQSAHPRALGNG
jgi:hypothetical protein